MTDCSCSAFAGSCKVAVMSGNSGCKDDAHVCHCTWTELPQGSYALNNM
jgi:hypothetical protein